MHGSVMFRTMKTQTTFRIPFKTRSISWPAIKCGFVKLLSRPSNCGMDGAVLSRKQISQPSHFVHLKVNHSSSRNTIPKCTVFQLSVRTTHFWGRLARQLDRPRNTKERMAVLRSWSKRHSNCQYALCCQYAMYTYTI